MCKLYDFKTKKIICNFVENDFLKVSEEILNKNEPLTEIELDLINELIFRLVKVINLHDENDIEKLAEYNDYLDKLCNRLEKELYVAM